jgi:hypothetical protein
VEQAQRSPLSLSLGKMLGGRHDIRHNDILHCDTWLEDIQHYDTRHNSEHCYAECQLCSMSFILSVIMLNVDTLSAIMLNVVMLNIVAPF